MIGSFNIFAVPGRPTGCWFNIFFTNVIKAGSYSLQFFTKPFRTCAHSNRDFVRCMTSYILAPSPKISTFTKSTSHVPFNNSGARYEPSPCSLLSGGLSRLRAFPKSPHAIKKRSSLASKMSVMENGLVFQLQLRKTILSDVAWKSNKFQLLDLE